MLPRRVGGEGMNRVLSIVGLLLTASAAMALGVGAAGYDSSFTDPVGDTVDYAGPSQAVRDAADVTGGTSAAGATNITIKLNLVGNPLVPGSDSYYVLSIHSGLATVNTQFNGTRGECDSCYYFYDYSSTGGPNGFGIVNAT